MKSTYYPWSTISLSKKERKGKTPEELDAMRRAKWETSAINTLRIAIVSEAFHQEKLYRNAPDHSINKGITVPVWANGFAYFVTMQRTFDPYTIRYQLQIEQLEIGGVVSCEDVVTP